MRPLGSELSHLAVQPQHKRPSSLSDDVDFAQRLRQTSRPSAAAPRKDLGAISVLESQY